jgi:hypothetical protein
LIDDTRQRDIQIANIRPHPNGKKWAFMEETELKGLKVTTSEGINLGRYPLEALHK